MTRITPPELQPSMTSLLSGLVTDVRTLFSQELAAARLEVENQLCEAKSAAVRLSIGLGFSIIVGSQLALMLAHGLAVYSKLPLWECYGLSGGVFAIIGAFALYGAKKLFCQVDINPLHTTQRSKEMNDGERSRPYPTGHRGHENGDG